jgi:hypothetical protein
MNYRVYSRVLKASVIFTPVLWDLTVEMLNEKLNTELNQVVF